MTMIGKLPLLRVAPIGKGQLRWVGMVGFRLRT
jgi:hypothetical protein